MGRWTAALESNPTRASKQNAQQNATNETHENTDVPSVPRSNFAISNRVRLMKLRQRITSVYATHGAKPKFNCHDMALEKAGYRLECEHGKTPRWTKDDKVDESDTLPSADTSNTQTVNASKSAGIMSNIVLKTLKWRKFKQQADDGTRSSVLNAPVSLTDDEIEEFGHSSLSISHLMFLKYLQLVQQNPASFKSLLTTAKPGADVSTNENRRLTNSSRIFEQGHRRFGRSDTPVQRASYELGPPYRRGSQSASANHPRAESAKSTPRVKSATNVRTQQSPRAKTLADTPLTKMEAARTKAIEWLREHNAGQVLAARQLCLRELDEEQGSLRQWWIAQRYCRYLRIRGRSGDSYSWQADDDHEDGNEKNNDE